MHLRNLQELQRRKAELKAQINQEQAELQETVRLIKDELTPANIVRKAITSLWKKDDKNAPSAGSGGESGMNLPVQLLVDLLIGNPRIAAVVKQFAPMLIAAVPRLVRKAGDALPDKDKVYGNVRNRISGWRSRLRKRKTKELPGEAGISDGDIAAFEDL
jgi:hypothetical protein